MDEEVPHSYRIAVYRAPGGYFAVAVGLPGCVARGASEVEAVENARASIRGYVAIARILSERRAATEVEVRP